MEKVNVNFVHYCYISLIQALKAEHYHARRVYCGLVLDSGIEQNLKVEKKTHIRLYFIRFKVFFF